MDFRIAHPTRPTVAVDAQAHLDSGAEKTLINGWVGAALGIDILDGPRLVFETTAGGHLSATVHPVRLIHDDLGAFDLEGRI